jgi:hypothetical protein
MQLANDPTLNLPLEPLAWSLGMVAMCAMNGALWLDVKCVQYVAQPTGHWY